jgi:chitin disaccharide deacetylase
MGTPALSERYLIVNADDFGQSAGVNRGIIEAHQHGIVTSASLMVRWPGAKEAAEYARGHPDLSLGLHFDLGEWAFRHGGWTQLYQVVEPRDLYAVSDELARQLTMFRRLVGRDPSHLDSHQHVHREQPVRSLLLIVAEELAIPLREFSSVVRYLGDFYGQSADGYPLPDRVSVDALIEVLAKLPHGAFTELGCHPGYADDLDTMYRDERALEVAVLCDQRLRSAIDAYGVRLCSFRGLSQ